MMLQYKLRQFQQEHKSTDVRTTSVYSYLYVLDTINSRQLTVLYVLKKLKEANNREIAEAVGIPINEVTPRIHELRNLFRCKYCGDTRAYAYKLKPDSNGNRRCKRCNKGYNGFYVPYPLVEESKRDLDLKTNKLTIYWKVKEGIDSKM